jgi:hypothetical protein
LIFSNIKTSACLQVSTKDVEVYFGQRFGLCKESSCDCESLGCQYEGQNLFIEKKRPYVYKSPET